ncbi:MAG: hypothetical protein IPK82_16405 [Polyangiaceae bacterium]|nr:hypothetical protein [Polyangiaceae bacterium]
MLHGLKLASDERLLWASQRGQPTRLPSGALGCRMAYAYVMLFALGGMVALPLLILPATRMYTVPATLVIALIAYLLYRRSQKPAIFVTDKRLLDRDLFGTKSIELANITAYRRLMNKYRDRYGTQYEVATNTVLVGLRSGAVIPVGPVAEYEELTDFLDGVISRDIHPTTMRSLDGKPAAAEQREDIFLAVENTTEGDVYGPLFIGPHGLVRFTEKFPLALQGLLLTALARPDSAETLEHTVLAYTKRTGTGHSVVANLDETQIGMDGTSLRITDAQRTFHVQLADHDAMRCRKFIKALPRGYR